MAVTRLAQRGMLALRADLSVANAQISDAFGLSVPAPLEVSKTDDLALLWFSPDELLLICDLTDLVSFKSRTEAALAGMHAMVTDVSDMRASFELRGPRLREVLAKTVPFDTHPDRFRQGQIRRTHLGQIAAAVWMLEQECAQILCFSSYASYAQDLLYAACDPLARVGAVSAT
ncbi:MAG: sarcosine oxidase subunit gamma family protein [Pseudomonadota bacterium]